MDIMVVIRIPSQIKSRYWFCLKYNAKMGKISVSTGDVQLEIWPRCLPFPSFTTLPHFFACELFTLTSYLFEWGLCWDLLVGASTLSWWGSQGRIKLFGAPRQWKYFRPLFQAVFLSGGGYYPQTVKHHASQSQDRNNKYFILYIEFCINNKI